MLELNSKTQKTFHSVFLPKYTFRCCSPLMSFENVESGLIFFSPICLHVFFFRRGSSARFFFSTELLLILKAYKTPHSLITVPLKVTISLESRFLRISSAALSFMVQVCQFDVLVVASASAERQTR